MRNSTAYFTGVATVFAATGLGFGGAFLLTSATAPRSPEPTKLERSVAAQAAPSPDVKSAAASDAGSPQNPSRPQPTAAAQTQQAVQPPAPIAPSPQTTSAIQTPAPASSATTASGPDQSTVKPATQSPSNAYARGSDDDVRKYIRKRERRWARRHYRDEDAMTAQTSGVPDQSNAQLPVQGSSTQQGSSAQSASSESVESQIKTPDQASAKVDSADARRGKRKHDRHWAHTNGRDDDDLHEDNRGRPVEVRETPQDEAPSFFAPPRWRPFSGESDDD